MGTKSKLERAVEEKAGTLNDAQKEVVMSQLSAYRHIKSQSYEVSDKLDALSATPAASHEEAKLKMADRMNLAYEYNQLSTACSKIASELFSLLDDDGRRGQVG